MNGVWASWLGLALTMLAVIVLAADRSVPLVIGMLITAALANAYGLLRAASQSEKRRDDDMRWLADLWNKREP
jgi:membrane protein implicated in regulation of membrane protease activity